MPTPSPANRVTKSFIDDQNAAHFKMGYDQRATSASYIKTSLSNLRDATNPHIQSGKKLSTVENLQIINPPNLRNSWRGNIGHVRP